MVSAADVSELLRFYADPRRHRWDCGPARDTTLSGAIPMQHVFQLQVTARLKHVLQIAGQNTFPRYATQDA